MSISFSVFNPITSIVENNISNAKIFAGLAITNSLLISTLTPLMKFISSDAVGEFFGLNSNEYKYSFKYFSAYSTAETTPAYLYFGLLVSDDRSPWVTGGKVKNPTATLNALKLITAGVLTVNADGINYSTTGIDLSAATSLSNVASIIQADVRAANPSLVPIFNFTYNGTTNNFYGLFSDTATTTDYFSSTTTGLATALQMTLATNATLSQGANVQTVAEALTILKSKFTDQFSIFFLDDLDGYVTDDENVALAQWVSDQDSKYNSLVWSNEVALESATDTTSIWYQINQAGIENCSIFDEVNLDNSERVFAYAGILASLDLTQLNSAITPAFKTQDGLLPSVSDTDIAVILNDKKINYYGNVGISGSPTVLNFFYGGYTTGKWGYTDNLVGQVWIAYQCNVAIARLFTSIGQVVNDPDGAGLVRAALTDAVETAVFNGIVAKGVNFDTATQLYIKTRYGINPVDLTNNGYVIINSPSTPSQRQNRISSVWSILYVKGSAIQFLPIRTDTFF